ncbi:Hus1-like protein [Tothia fuscella]|uniref:Checkpoint protein n=1 Tax=Tothia fuscella TaxID=1048955 RepID=A0A9P4TW56_9PEZI|nr:Hus1-like protein [Tothia fuscella]
MRFRAQIQNINIFNKFVTSLASLGPVAWVRLNGNEVRFTIIPDQGTQVWAVLTIDTIFDGYTVQSAANNVINLEVPLASLQRALRSALQATSASIRLTKKDDIPILSITIVSSSLSSTPHTALGANNQFPNGDGNTATQDTDGEMSIDLSGRERETIITQEVPVKVLSPLAIEGIHEPRCREPDVHIQLPPLIQLKSISDRFTKLALLSRPGNSTTGITTMGPRLELAANMHGCLKISIKTDAMNISSVWTGLSNPELDPGQVEGGEEGVREHASTRMKALGDREGRSEEGWSRVRIDGRDWGKVMSVGRLGGRVIACFCNDHALILYVYLPNDADGDESVLTYYVSSYSE